MKPEDDDAKPEDDDVKPEDDDAKPEHDAGAGARPPVTAQRIDVRSLVAGLAASMALLTRPNLLPLAVVMGCYLLVGTRLFAARRRAVGLAFGLLPGLACLGFLQAATYGSAVATGYGSPSAFMSVANMAPNFLRYGRWLLGAHTPVLMLALAAPLLMRHARHAWLLLAMSATTLACYLPYLVFDDWWYTRFLLPAIPLLVVLSVAVFVDGIERLLARLTWRPDLARLSKVRDVAAFAFLLVLASTWIATSRARHVFELSGLEQHYYRAGRASTRLPNRSVIVTVRNSGSVTYHAGVPILSWDTLEPQALETALRFARTRGLTPYLLLETDEEPVFRDRFASASAIGRLDWPPRVQVGRSIRIYDPMDRSAFFAGANVPTDFVSESAPPARDWRRWLR